MAKIISILQNKGGTGKTTTTIVLSQILSWLGYRVLVVDQDPQSNLSMYFGINNVDTHDVREGFTEPEKKDYNISELYRRHYETKEDVKNLIRKSTLPHIDILPSSSRLEKVSFDLMMSNRNNTILLKRALKTIAEDYDFILIDNAPANSKLTVNSLIASDYILVPVDIEEYSLKGLKETLSTLMYLKKEYDISAEFLGAFLNRIDQRTNAAKKGKLLYEESLGGKLFKTSIRHDTAIKELSQELKPILSLKKTARCQGLIDYCNLLIEMKLLDLQGEKRLLDTIEA